LTHLHLRSLDLVGFRGIRDRLGLRFGRRLTILYGGNATGKSSLSQAIEFVLTGQVLDPEDKPIPARYLANAMRSAASRVTLGLTDGRTESTLSASPDENRTQIEHRFRTLTKVEWPERQAMPVTTTHITSQGTLARVLARDSVTQHDLSGLCAGAYLRWLVTRAERLSDTFRQASGGRNVQTMIKDARAALESSRALRDSLAAPTTRNVPPSEDVSQRLRGLAAAVELGETAELRTLVAEVNRRFDETALKLTAVQQLLLRMRELGEHETELDQLQRQIQTHADLEAQLRAARGSAETRAAHQRESERLSMDAQVRASELIAAHERHQQAVSSIDSLQTRLLENQGSLVPLQEQITRIRRELDDFISKQRASSNQTVALEEALRLKRQQHETVQAALSASRLIEDLRLRDLEARIHDHETQSALLKAKEEAAGVALRAAIAAQDAAESALQAVSQQAAQFLAAVSELQTFIEEDACSLCGHHHGTRAALDAAIRVASGRRLVGSVEQQQRFEDAVATRRARNVAYTAIHIQRQSAELVFTETRQEADTLRAELETLQAQTRERLRRDGLQLPLTEQALTTSNDALTAEIEHLNHQLESARLVDSENLSARQELEQELAGRLAQADQATRIAQGLQARINELRANQGISVTPEALSEARNAMSLTASALARLQLESGKIAAELAESDRLLAEMAAQRAGAERRAGVIQSQLGSLDDELRSVGASRDVAGLLKLESDLRQRRDETLTLKARAASLQQEVAEFEAYKSYMSADEQYRAARLRLTDLTQRQERLTRRATQFAQLHKELRTVQSSTAETVLRNVREPVGELFRAMTAGCQWDIEFALNDDGRVEARLVDAAQARLPATAILNSAYLNVSAVALRVALASQQNWTELRTIVLDDPILEMDSLTQSALIDGLEAILASKYAPWQNLQLVLTTWSEDFAVLAAHKLAHINTASDLGGEEFLIYRLSSRPDGTVVPERHAPRWRPQVSAA
jgi:DNA repair protein SbcC/Rad50